MAWSTMLLRLVCESPRGTSSEGRDTIYRKMGNFRVVQFSRYFAVSHEPRKLKSAKYFQV